MNKPTFNQRIVAADLAGRLLLAAAMLLLGWMATWPFHSPAAAPASISPDSFSAERAMQDLQVIASQPHAAGTPAQAKVRDYLLSQIQAAGGMAEVQVKGYVQNVIARIPGSDPTRALLITGHYDSHPPAPGAGDNGISVAAMLETIRVLYNSPALRNDLVFLFTDGEEQGWLGAQAFIQSIQDERQDIGVVLVFDARPGNGALSLRETSAGDGWLVPQLAAARPLLTAGSWTNEDERTDTDTDFTVFSAADFMGVEIENEARGTLYHTSGDALEAISPDLVQGFGETMVRMARTFGSLDLWQAQFTPADVAYFTAPLVGFVYYPGWITPAAAVIAMFALVVLGVFAAQRKQLSLGRSLLGALAYLLATIVITLLASLLWNQLLAINPVTPEVAIGYLDFAGSASWITGMMLVAFVLFISVLYGLLYRVNPPSLVLGTLLVYIIVWWVAFFALDAQNPLSAPYLAWPLFGGVAGLATAIFVRQRVWLPVLLFLSSVPVILLSVPLLYSAARQPPDGPWIPVLAMGLSLGLLVPQIAYITGWLPPTIEAPQTQMGPVEIPTEA